MFNRSRRAFLFPLVLILFALVVAACQPAVLPTSVPMATAVVAVKPTQPPPPPPTETTAPAAPTSSPEPTAPQAIAVTGVKEAALPSPTPTVNPVITLLDVTAYCLPVDASVVDYKDPLNPPSYAKMAEKTTSGLQIKGLPANGCVLYYAFSGKAPEGLKLVVSERGQPKPFYTVDLKAVEDHPEVVWAMLRHGMILSPAIELLNVDFVVQDALGQEVRKDAVNMRGTVVVQPAPTQQEAQEPKPTEDCGCSVPIP